MSKPCLYIPVLMERRPNPHIYRKITQDRVVVAGSLQGVQRPGS